MNLYRLFFDFSQSLSECTTYLTEDSLRYVFFSRMMMHDPNLNNYIMELPYDLMAQSTGATSFMNKDLGIKIRSNTLKSSNKKLRQELDMYYENEYNGDSEHICIEFKFHRNVDPLTGEKTESDVAKTNNAGSLINDMRRLELICDKKRGIVRRLFVYVTDDEMHEYLANAKTTNKNIEYRQMLASFYLNGGIFSYDASNRGDDIPNTFYNSAMSSFIDSVNSNKTGKTIKKSFSISATKLLYVSTKTLSPSFLNNNCHISIFEIQATSADEAKEGANPGDVK